MKPWRLPMFAALIHLLPVGSSPSAAQSIEDLKSGVVKITAQVEGKTKVGTGFVVRLEKDVAYIVTAAHVIEGDPRPRVTFFPEPQQPVVTQVVGIETDRVKGLAAIRAAGPIPAGVASLSLESDAKISGGEPVTFIGFPRMLPPWTVSTGSVSGLKGPSLAFQALVEEGHSGGPLLLNGRVLGVVNDARERQGYAVPSSILAVALAGWRIEPRASEVMVPRETISADGVPMVLIRSGRLPTKVVKVYGGGRAEEIEGPPRSVSVVEDFYIETTLVTNARFRRFLEATTGLLPSSMSESPGASFNPEEPVEDVSWHDAVAYCRWVYKRLPTEDEWEKAARDTQGQILNDRVYEWTGSTYRESRWSPGEPPDPTSKVVRGSLRALNILEVIGNLDYQVRMHGRADERSSGRGFRCAETAGSLR